MLTPPTPPKKKVRDQSSHILKWNKFSLFMGYCDKQTKVKCVLEVVLPSICQQCCVLFRKEIFTKEIPLSGVSNVKLN